jgi:hypothetical protein
MKQSYLSRDIIKPVSKYLNDVILSSAKNLSFSCCYEILHGVYPEPNSEILRRACPELNDETLRYPQGDKAKGSG